MFTASLTKTPAFEGYNSPENRNNTHHQTVGTYTQVQTQGHPTRRGSSNSQLLDKLHAAFLFYFFPPYFFINSRPFFPTYSMSSFLTRIFSYKTVNPPLKKKKKKKKKKNPQAYHFATITD
jgi:hypothetical protein